MQTNNRYGVLLTPDAKLHRQYFEEMCSLIGIQIEYYAPRPDKHWTHYSEIKSNYFEPIKIGCIFDEHPTQQTLKKMGWVSELQESSSIIHVAYDTPNIQVGALFDIPSGLDCGKSRLFRCVKLSNSIVYPASVTCEIVPEYKDTVPNTYKQFDHSSFNLLNDEEGY